jgi:hypothetical protein
MYSGGGHPPWQQLRSKIVVFCLPKGFLDFQKRFAKGLAPMIASFVF